MKRTLKTIALCVIPLLGSGTAVYAQDLQKGLEAYEKGDYRTALREFRPLAKQGEAVAQARLGAMYASGEGVAQNYRQAASWFRKAAAQGEATAQYNLGVMYSNGLGVTQDDEEAVSWYRKAAAQGHAVAQTLLGMMYLIGQGVSQDNLRAHMWLNLAAASNGDELAPDIRQMFAQTMTPAEISKARKMARECVEKNYKGC